MVMFHSGSFEEYWIPLHCHYSQFHSEPEGSSCQVHIYGSKEIFNNFYTWNHLTVPKRTYIDLLVLHSNNWNLLSVWKRITIVEYIYLWQIVILQTIQLSSNKRFLVHLKIVTNKLFVSNHIYLIYRYRWDLVQRTHKGWYAVKHNQPVNQSQTFPIPRESNWK